MFIAKTALTLRHIYMVLYTEVAGCFTGFPQRGGGAYAFGCLSFVRE